MPHGRRRFDAVAEVQVPLQRRRHRRIGHVPGVEVARAVALQQRAVDDDRRGDRRRVDLLLPDDPTGGPLDLEDAPRRGREVDVVAVERRRRPAAAGALEADLGRGDAPHDRIVGAPGIELHQLPQLFRARVEALVLAGDVEEAVGVDHDRGVGVVAGPEAEDPPRRRGAAVQQAGDVPALHEAAGVREVHDPVAIGDRVLDRDVRLRRRIVEVAQELRRPSPARSPRSADPRGRARRARSRGAAGSRRTSCSRRPPAGSPRSAAARRPSRRSTVVRAPTCVRPPATAPSAAGGPSR